MVVTISKLGTSTLHFKCDKTDKGCHFALTKEKIAFAHRPLKGEVTDKIVKVIDGQKTDDKNPDAAKKSRSIVGLVIMSGAKKTAANEWKGQLYNRADGGTYSGTLVVKSKTAMDLSGCTAIVLCKTTTWTRVN